MTAAQTETDEPIPVGESRWPMAIAVLTLMGFTLAIPSGLTLLPNWIPVLAEGLLLLVLIIADPGRIDRQSRWIWRVSILLVAVLLLGTFAATAILVFDLITDAKVAQDAVPLLLAGARVWIGNNVAFALLYWQLDSGGPAVRLRALPPYPDFAFPQQQNPELARPGWRPHFIDYLYVGFTNANAFSPTDTLPMVSWAKIAMECQALLSFAIIGLVIAHAVNAFA